MFCFFLLFQDTPITFRLIVLCFFLVDAFSSTRYPLRQVLFLTKRYPPNAKRLLDEQEKKKNGKGGNKEGLIGPFFRLSNVKWNYLVTVEDAGFGA